MEFGIYVKKDRTGLVYKIDREVVSEQAFKDALFPKVSGRY